MEDAFESLFRREFAAIVRALTLVCGDPEAAADAVQDAFVQAHRHRDHVLTLDNPGAWLRHVALNRLRNHRRSQRRRDDALPRLATSGTAPEQRKIGDELDVAPLLDALSPQQRATVALYYLLDHPTAAIAQRLGINEATVRSHLRAARARLTANPEDLT